MLDWLHMLVENGDVPPQCVELVLNDGNHYFVKSIPIWDTTNDSLAIQVWDLRALTAADVEHLKDELNEQISAPSSLENSPLFSKLDFAILRIHVKDIHYCIEWHNRFWLS